MRRTWATGWLAVCVLGCSANAADDDVGAPRDDGRSETADRAGDGDGIDRTDTDGDTISDRDEGSGDTDRDGLPDARDLDSDADTVPDSIEAGDSDVTTPPVDTDRDGLPDFRDPDSDGDGLSDAAEETAGTRRTEPDSDGDGASDLVEVAAGTDPRDEADNPRARGDFVFIVPYAADPTPPDDTLVFGTDIRQADVYFAVDRSASMAQELTNLRDTLPDEIVPAIAAAIPDVWFGCGLLSQCPRTDCSETTPKWIKNLQNLAEDPTLTQDALGTISGTCATANEPYASTAWLIANGDPSVWGWAAARVAPRTCPLDGTWIGWPCFRPGAVPIIIMFGDEDFYTQSYGGACNPDTGGAPSAADAITEMNRIGARFIGINSGATLAGFRELCTGTGSVDATGNPLAFTIPSDGTGLGSQVIEAVELLASQVPMDITADAVDVDEGPLDAVDATVFIERVEPNAAGGVADPRDPTRVCVGGLAVEDRTADTHPDVFVAVLPGTVVCFDIYPLRNDSVPATAEPQLYRAQVRVLGDGSAILDTRDVYFLVPPEITIG